MKINEAVTATRNGAVAASISAVLTFTFVLVAVNTDADGQLALWNDPATFIDVVLILACAIGMYRKSRVASVVIFVYFLISKIIIAMETQVYTGFIVAVIFLYYFAKAIQGSFVYHRLKKAEDPNYKATTIGAYIVGVPTLLVLASLLGAALLSTMGVLPSWKVQAAGELGQDDISILRDNGIISSKDVLIYVYSHGLTSILESGNILTFDRVIYYELNRNNEIEIYEIPLQEITEVVLETQGNSFNDSVYRVNTRDPDRWLRLFLSTEHKGDKKFVDALRGFASAD